MDVWKRKLLAFLHDPPCKALDFGPVHEEVAGRFQRAAIPGMDEEWYRGVNAELKDADWTAAAADRFAFPAGKCAAKFSGQPGATFRHPLGGSEYVVGKLPALGRAEELLQNAFGGIRPDPEAGEAEQWRQVFFLYWRRWMEETVRTAPDAMPLAYLPADTRIPDHTIWTHMGLASALQACRVGGAIRPSFLVLQLGPVQEFIAAARSTRDLWSGSYLLSWLAAHAIKAVTDQVGPDCVIFPALRGQGVFDILHKDDVYGRISYAAGEDGAGHSLWDRMYVTGAVAGRQRLARRLLTPSLPNRFVALVPEDRGSEHAALAANAVSDELTRIGEACWTWVEGRASSLGTGGAEIANWRTRWDAQLRLFPQVTWAVVPWQHDIPKALAEFRQLPVNRADDGTRTPHDVLAAYHDLAASRMPVADRDERYYSDAARTALNNSGFLWSVNYHRAEFALAARRNTRDFPQFDTDGNQTGAVKDALTGREEIVGSEGFWDAVRSDGNGSVFKTNEGPYGAVTMVRRLWCRQETGYLFDKLGIEGGAFRAAVRFDSVPDLACGNAPNDRGDQCMRGDTGERRPCNPYVAVIVLDGDEMGRWVSGGKAPRFVGQLADSARPYFEDEIGIDPNLPRPVTPSYHMQFSEALANFANHVAERVVNHYNGQLVYAGGDDVLAMLPADSALACARALRAAFRGRACELPEPESAYELAFVGEGFLRVGHDRPILVPGPAAEVSCGIAFAHCDHPLQHIVEAARDAEGRAKSDYGRAALAVSLLKRGGETIQWGAKWCSGALELLDLYRELRRRDPERLSSRFPYALAELLGPYELSGRTGLTPAAGFDAKGAILLEFDHVAERQGYWHGQDDQLKADFRAWAARYLGNLAPDRLHDFPGLFLVAAFLDRERKGGDNR